MNKKSMAEQSMLLCADMKRKIEELLSNTEKIQLSGVTHSNTSNVNNSQMKEDPDKRIFNESDIHDIVKEIEALDSRKNDINEVEINDLVRRKWNIVAHILRRLSSEKL